jgi:hypothetical protein
MSRIRQLRRIGLLLLLPLLIGAGVAWHFQILPFGQPHARQNSLLIIAPYRYQGTWVFDDESVGLSREPFVSGMPEMIDVLVKDIPNADSGFRLLFSSQPFPGHQKKLTWLRGGSQGNYYELEDPKMEGWICPALFKYYTTAPRELYVKAEPINP